MDEELKIPKKMFDEYFERSKNCVFLGIPLSEFSRDELLAIVACGIHDNEVMRNDTQRHISFMQQLDKMRDNARLGL